MSVDVRLPQKRKRIVDLSGSEPKHIVSPGDVITEDTGYMRYKIERFDSIYYINISHFISNFIYYKNNRNNMIIY